MLLKDEERYYASPVSLFLNDQIYFYKTPLRTPVHHEKKELIERVEETNNVGTTHY